jgi:DNA-binding CsgD family transcriptional regulator
MANVFVPGPADRSAAEDALRLTQRQREVIASIANGHTDVEIAALLSISPRTVRAHCDRLRMKLEVRRRREIPAAFRRLTGSDPMDAAEG